MTGDDQDLFKGNGYQMNGECTRVQKLLDVTAVGDTVAGGGLSIAVLLCEQ